MQAPISKIPAPDSLDQPYQLSEEQIQSFNKNGFLILKDLFDEKAKEAIVSWSHDVQNWPEVRGSSWMPYRERKADGQTGLCRVENYADSVSLSVFRKESLEFQRQTTKNTFWTDIDLSDCSFLSSTPDSQRCFVERDC